MHPPFVNNYSFAGGTRPQGRGAEITLMLGWTWWERGGCESKRRENYDAQLSSLKGLQFDPSSLGLHSNISTKIGSLVPVLRYFHCQLRCEIWRDFNWGPFNIKCRASSRQIMRSHGHLSTKLFGRFTSIRLALNRAFAFSLSKYKKQYLCFVHHEST